MNSETTARRLIYVSQFASKNQWSKSISEFNATSSPDKETLQQKLAILVATIFNKDEGDIVYNFINKHKIEQKEQSEISIQRMLTKIENRLYLCPYAKTENKKTNKPKQKRELEPLLVPLFKFIQTAKSKLEDFEEQGFFTPVPDKPQPRRFLNQEESSVRRLLKFDI